VLKCKWVAECLFSAMLEKTRREEAQLAAMGPIDYDDVLGANALTDGLPVGFQRRTPMPRPLPFEGNCSNGMAKGASVDFISERLGEDMVAFHGEDCLIGVNFMVSIQLKQQDGESLLLQMLSESSLTQMEYLRFTLHCSMRLRGALEYLVAADRGSSPCAFREVEDKLDKIKGKINKQDRNDLVQAVQVLLFANVLYAEPRP